MIRATGSDIQWFYHFYTKSAKLLINTNNSIFFSIKLTSLLYNDSCYSNQFGSYNIKCVEIDFPVYIFMKVFEVSDLPMWIVTALCGIWPYFLGGEYFLDGVARPWDLAGTHKKSLYSLKEGDHLRYCQAQHKAKPQLG